VLHRDGATAGAQFRAAHSETRFGVIRLQLERAVRKRLGLLRTVRRLEFDPSRKWASAESGKRAAASAAHSSAFSNSKASVTGLGPQRATRQVAMDRAAGPRRVSPWRRVDIPAAHTKRLTATGHPHAAAWSGAPSESRRMASSFRHSRRESHLTGNWRQRNPAQRGGPFEWLHGARDVLIWNRVSPRLKLRLEGTGAASTARANARSARENSFATPSNCPNSSSDGGCFSAAR